VPIELNITDQGFPNNVNGLKAWKMAFNSARWTHYAFATSVVLTPDGSKQLGSSGGGFAWQWKTAANYHADRYLNFLTDAMKRFDKSEVAS